MVVFGLLGPINTQTQISDCFSGQNQKMRPLYKSNYTHITIVKWSQNLLLISKTVISGCLGLLGHKNA